MNACCFERKELPLSKLKVSILKALYEWTWATITFSTSNLLELLNNVNFRQYFFILVLPYARVAPFCTFLFNEVTT